MKRHGLCIALCLFLLFWSSACGTRSHPPGRAAYRTIHDDTIYIVSLRSRQATPLPSPYRPWGDPAWSPDGMAIAYFCATPGTGRGICIHRASTSEIEIIDQEDLHVEPLVKGDLAGSPAWSADGGSLYFTSRASDDTTVVYKLDLADRTVQVVCHGDSAQSEGETPPLLSAAPSPSETLLAMVSSGHTVWIADIATCEQERIALGSLTSPMPPIAWSPDGQRLAIVDLSSRDIRIISPDGTGQATIDLDERPISGPIAWLSNDQILFLQGEDETGDVMELKTIDVESERIRVIMRGIDGYSLGLAWSPVSTWPLDR